MTFNPTLTLKDKALTKAFIARLKQDGKTYWTSDDFRQYGLDRLMTDPQHEIGAYFARLKWHGHIIAAGEEASAIVSNNKRKVDLCRFHPRVEGWLNSKPINAYNHSI